VQFVGRLSADQQAHWYGRAQWYLSLPASDSVSVSVLEALGHGCIPVLSDLPANHELVRSGDNGLVLAAGQTLSPALLQPLLSRAADIAHHNRAWVSAHGLFAPAVQRLLTRLHALTVPT
jgi:glycosyltransferase involved in cell wall biosynthesis